MKLAENPVCEAPGCDAPAVHVHHRRKRRGNPELVFELSNLQSLCVPCHMRMKASER